MEYASNGKANAGLATGIIGTALSGLLWAGGATGLLNRNGTGGWGFGSWNGNTSNGFGPGYGYGFVPGFSNGGCYSQSFEGKIGQLESEIAYLNSENYTDKAAAEVYRTLNNKIESNFSQLFGAIAEIDKKSALNAQGLAYENQLTNQKIDCCCEKAAMQTAFNKQLSDLADASIISYVNSNFLPGTLKLPITSICPQPATPTTTPATTA